MIKRSIILFTMLTILIAVLLCLNLFYGAVKLPVSDVWDTLTGADKNSIVHYIVVQNRMPQAITALLGGAGLAVTGLMLQTAFSNPLAGPSILGISSGASLGVALVMLALGGTISFGDSSIAGYAAVIFAAIIGSMSVTGILTIISLRVRNTLMLLIVGIMTGYLTSSIVTLLSSLSAAQNLHNYIMWGTGSFSQVSLRQLPFYSFLIAAGLVGSLALAKPLNILLLGDNYARNLGVRVEKVKTILLIVTGILTALITAFCGPVAFIGLAMPHIARMLFRTDNHWILMPASMMSGGILAMACTLVSVIPENHIIPINAITPIVGVPVILYVVLSRQR